MEQTLGNLQSVLREEQAKESLGQIASALLAWYDKEARVLPWREDPKPYRVWLSEIMLQQTRVSAVIPYFERFLQTLPTIADLAQAPEDLLLKLWEGLGYYSRARNLQKAARIVAAEYNGELPNDYEKLQKLPGIGEYTASAISSIAFGRPEPVVDGNVLRVFARILAFSADIARPQTKKHLRSLLEQVIPTERPGDFNQAMMELGAMVCLPNGAPECQNCPVSHLCRAYELDQIREYPVKTKAATRKIEKRTVFLVCHQNRVLLRKRPDSGLLAGMWEFPNTDRHIKTAEIAEVLREFGIDAESVKSAGNASHIFSHIEWNMKGFFVEADSATPEGWVWASWEELEGTYSLPHAFRAYRKALQKKMQ